MHTQQERSRDSCFHSFLDGRTLELQSCCTLVSLDVRTETTS